MAIEEPEFTVESKNAVYEIRKYEPVLVAETQVQAAFDKAGNQAFRILAAYIFGENKAKSKIADSGSLTQQAVPEKIAMTAPVSQIESKDGYLVQFTMPKPYTLETVPTPNDSRVHLRVVPARRVAVFTYSGSWSQEKYNQKLEEFQSQLRKDKVEFVGEPVFARYNSPFTLWFLRRNEIWLELAPKAQ